MKRSDIIAEVRVYGGVALLACVLSGVMALAAPAPLPVRQSPSLSPHPRELLGVWELGWAHAAVADHKPPFWVKLDADGGYRCGLTDKDAAWDGDWHRDGDLLHIRERLIGHDRETHARFVVPTPPRAGATIPEGYRYAGTTCWLQRPTKVTD